MKELSIEEKAKAYDKKLAEAKEMLKDGSISQNTIDYIQKLYPELAESEDERIREELINAFKEATDSLYMVLTPSKREAFIAWLEKQGEHAKFRDSIQVGDKVTRNQDGMLVNLSQLKRVAKKDEKQVEQKPVEISNICEFSIETWIKIVDYVLTEHNGIGNYLIDPEVKDTAEKLQKKYKFDAASEEWDRVYRKGLDAGVNKGRAEALREQKPADKVEPKFHKGEWLCENEPNNYARFIQILEVVDVQGKERYRISRDLHNDEDVVECRFIENNYHSFNIQDAKDGDVLHSTGFHNDCIFIFNRLDNWKFDESNGDRAVATGYCCLSISADKMEFGIQGPDCVEVNTIKPATKIQRDLLFQKMKEAGYEWDAEKKELKEIEQKPTEWSEEDEKTVHLACEFIRHHSNHIDSIGGIDCSTLIERLNSLKDRVQPSSCAEGKVTTIYNNRNKNQ